eukprot:CAMPEP_0206258774 /NCGR_PEP_ID=MMETSP0047_2-20121206/26117_1 /ASSEMBLY_ACC=CAM_ASM_000192 /TAXON_ID=195065 /ORGANISM="Chroomonas mesostigmatica_cf, Strain CCMP1168" /LENGTH=87 /DNA_ID=CAMNT_0053685577 /DNA_START=18 /DNA_END=278 /DNA_ORIENTATION=-
MVPEVPIMSLARSPSAFPRTPLPSTPTIRSLTLSRLHRSAGEPRCFSRTNKYGSSPFPGRPMSNSAPMPDSLPLLKDLVALGGREGL